MHSHMNVKNYVHSLAVFKHTSNIFLLPTKSCVLCILFLPWSRLLSDMHVWHSLLSMTLFHTTLMIMLNSLKCRTLTFSRLMTYIYICRTAPLTSRCSILYIYSTNIRTEYFKHAVYSPVFPLQNAVYFIMLPFLVHVLFTLYIQVC